MEASVLATANNGLEYLPAFLTSLAIGLFVGLERERSPAAKAGLRTFALTALLGTLLALLSEYMESPWLLAAGLLAVAGLIVSAYLDGSRTDDPGTTTQAALLLCFGLGALVWFGFGALAVLLAVAMTLLLHFKPELQNISKSLTRQDLQSILQFAVLSFVILPVLPNRDFGPFETLNPYQTWLMVVLISGLSLAGYVSLRFVGQRFGAPLLGFFGGMVSSTATTLIYARHARSNENLGKLAVVVIMIANLVVLIRLAVVSSLVAPGIAPHLIPVLAGGLVAGSLLTFFWWRRIGAEGEFPMPEMKNPTEIRTALTFAALYAVISLISAWLANLSGSSGLYLLAFISGLTDVDAISISMLRLFDQGKLTPDVTVATIVIAYLSNLLFKFGLVMSIGGRTLARLSAPAAAATALGMILVLFAGVSLNG
ncbi:MAG: MgtC/SapB family protein [Candidatus Accumulibacter sp.]|nr:MgtC/SapB family protein [Accumulibacter sp.]